MGSLIAEAPSAEKIEHLVKPVKDLFGAVFFVSVGMLVDPALLLEYAVPIIVLVIVTLVGKLLLSGAGVLLSGQNLNTSMHCGFSLAQIGEFSFIIASLGMSLGVYQRLFISNNCCCFCNDNLYYPVFRYGSRTCLSVH